jgi:L-asparaginase
VRSGTRPKVRLIFTGGTIASKRDPATGKAEAVVDGEELLAAIPELREVADVTSEQYSNVSGNNLSLLDMFAIARRACTLATSGSFAGVVVAHGTATIAESAFYADLVLGPTGSVIYTGAMYNASEPDSDGPRNLLNSVRVAADAAARDKGALVCLDGEIHAARDATKVHTTRLSSISSHEHGSLGVVDPDQVVFYRKPLLRRTFTVDRIEPNVDLISVAAGMDDRLVRASVELGAAGLVIEGLPGTGGVTLPVANAVREALADRVPVVITTRCPSGRVRPVYGGGPGSKDMADAGCIMAGDLAAAKARILMTVALVEDPDIEALRTVFAEIAA